VPSGCITKYINLLEERYSLGMAKKLGKRKMREKDAGHDTIGRG
jgi:hypothetical protein